MVTVIVRFALRAGISAGEALAEIREMLPMYRAEEALVSKQISLDMAARRGTSVYLWDERAAAEAFFAMAREALKEQTGAEPEIELLATQVYVNNRTGETRIDG